VPNILFLGCDALFASQLAARSLASSQHCVVLRTEDKLFKKDEFVFLVQGALRKQMSGASDERAGEELAARCSVECFERGELAESEGESQFEEIWLVEGLDSANHASTQNPIDRVRNALSLLLSSNARVFNYVYPIYSACESSTDINDVEDEIRKRCETGGKGYRVFRVGALLGENYLRGSSGCNDVRQLMAALDGVSAEVQERLPEYFDYQSLHLLARPNARMNIVRMEGAADVIFQLAQQESTLGKCHTITSSQDFPIKNIARILGKAYGAGITVVTDREQLNAIDRLLAERFTAIDPVFSGFSTAEPGREQETEWDTKLLAVDESSLKKLVAAAREQQLAERATREVCASNLVSQLAPRSIERPGGRLEYFVAGSHGPHVLILNALGQRLKFWTRMLECLAQFYRVVVWETRGLEYDSEPLKVSDHVGDIESILEREEIKQCYVLGWCTGPQLATEFYLSRPEAVLGMVFLNSVFKFEKRLDVETPYSINLEKLCRLLDRRPEMAPSVMQSLSAPPANDINLESTDSHNTAQQVLMLTNVQLRTQVLDPFRTVKTTLNYARQIVNLLACPVVERLNQVDVPVLIVGCEYDQVASPAKSREAASLLPNCKYVELKGATHYSIYDRTEVVAAMLRHFFDAPSAVVPVKEPLAAMAS
jgi:pimeloyl-ACP methyl ester carboxylesterase